MSALKDQGLRGTYLVPRINKPATLNVGDRVLVHGHQFGDSFGVILSRNGWRFRVRLDSEITCSVFRGDLRKAK